MGSWGCGARVGGRAGGCGPGRGVGGPRQRPPVGALAGVSRVDIVHTLGDSEVRLADVPFDADAGEVLMIPSPAWLKAMPAFTMRTRLVAVGAAGEQQLGDYTFNHSPS